MEPAKIDWKRLEWHFVEDELYEHINAPKWVDFLSLDHSSHDAGDEAWFCKPDCKHPKTAEDFLRAATTLSKASVSENLPLGDQNRRDVKIKRRVAAYSSASPPDSNKSRFNQDSENQNPNLFTPPMNLLKSMKVAIKSSEEKNRLVDHEALQDDNNKAPPLRPTPSAKNLLLGRPILTQITEFCNELKRLATRAREKESTENLIPMKGEEELVIAEKASSPVHDLPELDRREKERKPLLELSKTDERLEGVCVKGKLQQKKRPDEAENMPVCLDLEDVKHKREEILRQIRTNPPSPQCFSASHGGPNKTTSSKGSKSRLMERGILQEVGKNNEVARDSPADNNSRSISTVVDGRETKALDMLWFFKPCTLSS